MKKSLLLFICAFCCSMTFSACFGDSSGSSSGQSQTGQSSSSEEVESSGDETESSSVEAVEKYTVTFKQADQIDQMVEVVKGDSLESEDIPAVKEKTGYTIRWEEVDLTNITEDITVNAVETANTYTITYDANGGSVTPATQEVVFDSTPTLATPTREDYLFNCWTYEGTAVVNGAAWTIADDVTLVAEWTDNRPTYTVTFVDGTQSKAVEVKKGESVSADDVPAFVGKVGYSVAWDITNYTNIVEDVTVTAIYTANTYTITYDAEGFAVDGTTVQLTYDALCTALDMSLTKADANFLGWKYGEVTYTNQSVWNVANNVSVTPDWEAKDQVTVVFTDTDGSTINKTIYAGQTLTDIPTPKSKVGYTVDNVWYADEARTQEATFTNVQAGFTVYAKATANTYTVSYDANGGTMSALTQDITFDSEYTLLTPTHENAYMRFDGWQMESGNMLASTGTWTMTEDVSVTAKWTDTRETYTISFVQAGQEIKTFSVKAGESFTEIPAPVAKTGYTVAWDVTDFTNITNNITVTAIETAKTYAVSLKVDGAVIGTISVAYNSAYDLTIPSKVGYTFKKWTYNGAEIATTGTWTIDATEIEVVAVFEAKTYTVTFDSNGGSAVESQDITYGSTPTLIIPQREGYTFSGWYYNGVKVESDEVWTIDGNGITLKAEWKKVDNEWTSNY